MKKTLLSLILYCSSAVLLAQRTPATAYFNTNDDSNDIGLLAENTADDNRQGAIRSNPTYSTASRDVPTTPSTNGRDSLRYAEFAAPLVKSLQDLTAQLDAQEKEIKALRKQLGSSPNKVRATMDSTTYTSAALYQTYPDALSTETEIKVSLSPGTNNANLIFYTIDGIQIKVLHLFNRGTFNVKIDNRDLGVGTCFYALMVEGKIVDSKRLLVRRRS